MYLLDFLKLLTGEQIKEIMRANGIWQDDFHNFGYLHMILQNESVTFVFDSETESASEVSFYFNNDSIRAAFVN